MKVRCKMCNEEADHWAVCYCPGCNDYFCSDCWEKHRKEARHALALS